MADKMYLTVSHVHGVPCDICFKPGAVRIETIDIDPIAGTESSRFYASLIFCIDHWNWLVINGISAEEHGSPSTIAAAPS